MALLVLVVVLNAAGQIAMKAGASGTNNLLQTLFRPMTLVGLGAYGISTLLWITVLRNEALSRSYPAIALTYVVVMLAAAILFREPLTPLKLVGAALVTLGVYCIWAGGGT